MFSSASAQSTTLSSQPLRQIGLAISGGGFRAAAFGLGCLSYLEHCSLSDPTDQRRPLLECVTFMSTTSGGSFVSLLYAGNLYQGKAFADTYQQLLSLMNGDGLLKDAMQILDEPDAWLNTPHKQRNLINAYALALTDHQRLGNATFDPLCQPGGLQPHLRQICVNVTEFRNGLSFRFQNVDGQNRQGFVGNFNLHFRRETLATIRKLRLADIMAASSCFPAGFEPLIFPQDFTYATPDTALTTDELQRALFSRDVAMQTAQLTNQLGTAPLTPTLSEVDLTLEAEKNDDLHRAGHAPVAQSDEPAKQAIQFGLMDGGIDDNQGIQGLLLGDSRAKNQGRSFDTLIVCDVASPYLEGYKPPLVDNRGWRRLSLLKLTFWGSLLLIGLPVLVGFWWADPIGRTAFVTFGLTLGLLLSGMLLGLWYWLRNVGGIKTWGLVLREHGGYFFRIPFGTLWQMITARLSSVVLLSGDVFMKQVRRLIYQQFFSDKAYRDRQVTALIYELSTTYYPLTKARNKNWNPVPLPSDALKAMAEEARQMDTTLWFDQQQVAGRMRDKLIATGQFTLCYNLMEYIDRVKALSSVPPEHQKALLELDTQLKADWEKFQMNPLWLVDR